MGFKKVAAYWIDKEADSKKLNQPDLLKEKMSSTTFWFLGRFTDT